MKITGFFYGKSIKLRAIQKIISTLVIITGTMCICLFIASIKGELSQIENSIYTHSKIIDYDTSAKRDLLCLLMAYPQYIKGVKKDDKYLYVIMNSDKSIIYDDKKVKTSEQKLSNPDLQDMMEQIYPLYDISELMDMDYDPGRLRVQSFFEEIYGGAKSKIESNLQNVNAGNKTVLFNKKNGASEELKEVFKELNVLVKTKTGAYNYVFPVNGTYNYRVVAGTNRLSAHAYGIAIDLKSDKKDYWKWATREQGQERISKYPVEVVRIFEKHNFIWGGKWGHFDILHFEYRPELILKSKYNVSKEVKIDSWYQGFPYNEETKEYIALIDGL